MDHASKIIEYCLEGKSIIDLMTLFDRKNRTKFKKTFINPLLEEKLLSLTMPDKPKSPKQAYISTYKGKKILNSISPGKDQTNNLVPKPGLSWDHVGTKLGLSMDYACKILEYCLDGKSITDLMIFFDRKNRTKFKKTFINPLLEENLLSITIPGKPKSSKQAYITTSKGKQILESISPGKDKTIT